MGGRVGRLAGGGVGKGGEMEKQRFSAQDAHKILEGNGNIYHNKVRKEICKATDMNTCKGRLSGIKHP